MFAIAFLASFLAVQTTASRMIWSYARDHAVPASGLLHGSRASARSPCSQSRRAVLPRS